MRARALGFLLVLGLAVIVVLATRGGPAPYTLKVRLADAGGLRNGSPVVIGGVPIGDVRLHAKRDFVEADLRVKDQYAKTIGRDAVVGIIAQNVVGQKQMRVQPGDPAQHLASGSWIPARHVRETTDLDQLLSTLDPDTRVRLAILINETGTAFAGRKLDFNTFLRDFAPALSRGGQVVHDLARDNRALSNLVANSDGFIAELARQRRRFTRVLDNAGRAADVVAARRAQLAQTLHDAPDSLRTTRAFLADLRHTTGPLQATARLLTATAPSLSDVLGRLAPFERQVGPALHALRPIGREARRTGHVGAPVRRLVTTVTNLKSLTANEIAASGPVIYGGFDNGVAALDNWAHAIQYRDGMGHIFRGEASFSSDLYSSVIGRVTALLPTATGGQARKVRLTPLTPTRDGGGAAGAPQAPAAAAVPAPASNPITAILDQAAAAGQALPAAQPAAAGKDATDRLLGFLVGK